MKIISENLQKLDEIQNLASVTSKMTSWPQLDLIDLGRGWVIFFKNYIFKISASSWGKWAISRISSQTFKIQNFVYFMAASEDRELKTGICKSLTRKPSCISFFSAWSTDFKNIFFEKIHWATSEVVEVKRSFSRSPRPSFGFHLVLTSFHLEFSSFWISRLFDLGDLHDLENGPSLHSKNGLKSIQIFQIWMGGMNRR
mgnify:CR=1 FL=1